ncbi:MAG: hypothetical protein GY778_01735 [bacterium]|nr:hypothetical protein [bacterium]
MIRVSVIMLGPARDLTGVEEAAVELAEGSPLVNLIEQLAERFPKMAPGLRGDSPEGTPSVRLAVNREFCSPDHTLADGDEVAVIPPVSGGLPDEPEVVHVALVHELIDAAAERRRVGGDHGVGGLVTFEGTTRAEHRPDHSDLIRLHYEAYEDMALAQMRRLADDARQRWAIQRVALVHRLGDVPLGEASVLIIVACGHRAEAFEACCWLIDRLKQDVPIWKKDVWADGATSWVDPTGGGKSEVRSEK